MCIDSGAGRNLKMGGTGPERKWGALPFLALKVQLVVLVSAFVMASIVWSVSCLLFFYSQCPRAMQPFVKVEGGHVPPCPMESAPLCIHPISRPNCKPITVSSCYTTSVTSPNFRSCRAICLHVSIFHEYSRAKTGSDCGLLTGLVGHGRLLIRLRD